jgi:hypothetical protein
MRSSPRRMSGIGFICWLWCCVLFDILGGFLLDIAFPVDFGGGMFLSLGTPPIMVTTTAQMPRPLRFRAVRGAEWFDKIRREWLEGRILLDQDEVVAGHAKNNAVSGPRQGDSRAHRLLVEPTEFCLSWRVGRRSRRSPSCNLRESSLFWLSSVSGSTSSTRWSDRMAPEVGPPAPPFDFRLLAWSVMAAHFRSRMASLAAALFCCSV